MAILNHDHLFEQAERLIAPPPKGPPRQVDLRRAVSSAYYGVFHFILAAAADMFVGGGKHRSTNRYALVYRSIDHASLRKLCADAKNPKTDQKYLKHLPGGFGSDLQAFASILVELYQQRHSADYDPSARFVTSEAKLNIETAKIAVKRFQRADPVLREAFLTLLLFSRDKRT